MRGCLISHTTHDSRMDLEGILGTVPSALSRQGCKVVMGDATYFSKFSQFTTYSGTSSTASMRKKRYACPYVP